MKNAVLLLSSGLDSAANLALSFDDSGSENFKVSLALTINYGQKGALRELEQAEKIARHFQIEHLVFDLRQFTNLIGKTSALMGTSSVPQLDQAGLDDSLITKKSAAAVWVPNRNAVLLSLAAALAEARGLDAVAVGFNAEEAVTFADNSPAFMSALTHAFSFSTANQVQIVSHTAHMNKHQIVENLDSKKFPFELLWSCYEASSFHCGRCESCQRLKRAVQSGIKDPARRAHIQSALFGGVAANAESRT